MGHENVKITFDELNDLNDTKDPKDLNPTP